MGGSSRRCGRTHTLKSVVAVAACGLIVTACASTSYQTAAMKASEDGNQKAAIDLAKKEVARILRARPMLPHHQPQLRDACAGLRHSGQLPDTGWRQNCRRREFHQRQGGVERDGSRDQAKCHRHGLSRRLRSVLERRRSGARRCRIQRRSCRGCRQVAVHVLCRPGCRSAAACSAIDGLTGATVRRVHRAFASRCMARPRT